MNETEHKKIAMHFKLIVAFVEDSKTDDIMEAVLESRLHTMSACGR